MNTWVTVYRSAWLALIIMGMVVLVCLFLPKYNALRRMRREVVEKEEENRRIEARIAELRTNQERFLTDPAFVERTARETGMVKPHEVLFKKTNRTSQAESPISSE